MLDVLGAVDALRDVVARVAEELEGGAPRRVDVALHLRRRRIVRAFAIGVGCAADEVDGFFDCADGLFALVLVVGALGCVKECPSLAKVGECVEVVGFADGRLCAQCGNGQQKCGDDAEGDEELASAHLEWAFRGGSVDAENAPYTVPTRQAGGSCGALNN